MPEMQRLATLDCAMLSETKAILANVITGLAYGREATQEVLAGAHEVFSEQGVLIGLEQLPVRGDDIARSINLAEVLLDAGLQPSSSAARRLRQKAEGGRQRSGSAPELMRRLRLGPTCHYALVLPN